MESNDSGREYDYLLYLAAADTPETQTFVTALQKFGGEIKVFHQPEAFAAALADREPHVMVLDCDADQGRLSEAVMQTRTTGTAAQRPVIFISSKNNFDQRLAAVRAGVDGYFIKPLDLPALSDHIDNKMSLRKIRSYRILAVDDDVMLSSFYEVILNMANMHVKVLNDPSNILTELEHFQPELILMDMHMPVCSGAEAAKIIRQNNQYLDIPIVFLSSDDDVDRQVLALETGADNFLTKPIDPENLISIITSHTERYRALRKGRGTA